VAELAYSLEKLSTHPLARAVTRYGKHERLTPPSLDHFESIAGQGLQARRDGNVIRLGKREWIAGQTPAVALSAASQTAAGLSEVWLTSGDLIGRVVLRDDIRPLAGSVVAQLRQLGLRTVVLTGDRQAAALELKQRLGPDEVRAELKPEQKVDFVREFTRQGRKVAMIGDGVNDAPSLAVAHVGVAMGARGSDAALEQAEVVLMHDRLENFLTAFQLSQRARTIIRQNLFVSLGTVVLLVSFALLGQIPLTLGVIGHEGSTVVVVVNSLRLLLMGRGRTGPSPAIRPA
jgi:Cd2+/Zn2+-exporting ATPase